MIINTHKAAHSSLQPDARQAQDHIVTNLQHSHTQKDTLFTVQKSICDPCVWTDLVVRHASCPSDNCVPLWLGVTNSNRWLRQRHSASIYSTNFTTQKQKEVIISLANLICTYGLVRMSVNMTVSGFRRVQAPSMHTFAESALKRARQQISPQQSKCDFNPDLLHIKYTDWLQLLVSDSEKKKTHNTDSYRYSDYAGDLK